MLVHCQGGVSRSAAITIAYLMYHMKLPLKDAYKFVKDKRSCIAPNLNFMGQLMEFEKQICDNQLKRTESSKEDFSGLCKSRSVPAPSFSLPNKIDTLQVDD